MEYLLYTQEYYYYLLGLILLLLLISIHSYNKNNYWKYLSNFLVFIFSIFTVYFIGTRDMNIGTDTSNYYRAFQFYESSSTFIIRKDPIFDVLNYISSQFFDFQALLLFCAFLYLFEDLRRFILRFIREKNKIVLNSEIDVVFEASWFASGDQWTYRLAKFMDKNIKKWKKQNTKIIIMPQAFGPFNKVINAKFTKSFIDNADLVYIRDKESLMFVKELKVKKEKLNLCPDFSFALNAKQTDSYNYLKNMICLIPNNKVITTSSDIEIKDKYISFLTNIIKYYKSKFKNVFLLNHEGQGDYDLALDIQK